MFQIRIHGRGGQGVVTAAELLSLAAFADGKHAQAFPSFGSERTGAPVTSFCRVDDREIRTREPVVAPDALVVQDATLLHHVDVFAGLRPEGYVLINSARPFAELGLEEWARAFRAERLRCVPASDIAREHPGARPNAALLGGLAALTGVVTLDSLIGAIEQRFGGRGRAGPNAQAARVCFERVSPPPLQAPSGARRTFANGGPARARARARGTPSNA
ncbi:MAG TPA: 2-oxoacid:acceptor oxidoreductase family protein [Solirubrobacteraceae bacterium]|nr:2-oxoacid:acceptor oxidoreductase family protein [Solirubrobacteraceae bacterium]